MWGGGGCGIRENTRTTLQYIMKHRNKIVETIMTSLTAQTAQTVRIIHQATPHLVDSRKIKYGESGSLNINIRFSLSSDVVDPSRRRQDRPLMAKKASRMVMT